MYKLTDASRTGDFSPGSSAINDSTQQKRTREPQRLSLRRNFSWVFVGTVVYNVALWAMLLIIVKLGTAGQVGVYALARAVVTPVNYFTGLHLRPALVADVRHEHSYGHYIGLRICTGCVTLLISTSIAFAADYQRETRIMIVLVALGASIYGVRDIFLAIVQKHECMNYCGRSQVILAVLSLTAFAAVFATTRSLSASIGALLCARMCVLLTYDVPVTRLVLARLSPPDVSTSLAPSWLPGRLVMLGLKTLPLGIAITLVSLCSSIPCYFLQGWHGETALGYYGALVSIIGAGMVIMNTVGMAASPRLARYYVDDRRSFVSLVCRLQLIGVAAGVLSILAVMVFGRPLLGILFKPEYADYAPQFILLTVAMALMFLASFLGQAMTASRAFNFMLYSWGFTGVVSLGFAGVLIPEYGITGACWTFLASSCSAVLALAVALWAVLRRPAEGMLNE